MEEAKQQQQQQLTFFFLLSNVPDELLTFTMVQSNYC